MSEDTRARGQRLFEEICGAPPAALEDDFIDVTIDHLFGDLWAREDLAVRDRRLLTIAVLVTLGERDALRVHMEMALRSGDVSESELRGVVLHLAHYAGWPRGSLAFTTLAAVLGAEGS